MSIVPVCIFIGHSDAPSEVYPALLSEVYRHFTEYGVTDFRMGSYGNFDHMAAQAVREVKKLHPEVRLSLMLAYLPTSSSALPYNADKFDAVIFPEGMETAPPRYAISKLNRIMVRDADYAIAYVTRSWGGAAKTLEIARAKERRGSIVISSLVQRRSF